MTLWKTDADSAHTGCSARLRWVRSVVGYSVTIAVICLIGSSRTAMGSGEVASWHRVLERYVIEGGVDYASLAADTRHLDAFLEILRGDQPPTDDAESTAFWINAYNAVVLKLVSERYPLESVMDVDGFFDEIRSEIGGELLTLDEIEQRALATGDPRVHFAVVCAARSCPALRHEPFVGDDLDRQLEDQTRDFLADTSKGARFEESRGVLWLSSLFKWYADDFTSQSKVVAFFLRGPVAEWTRGYLPETVAEAVGRDDPTVRYLEYDWTLNDQSPAE